MILIIFHNLIIYFRYVASFVALVFVKLNFIKKGNYLAVISFYDKINGLFTKQKPSNFHQSFPPSQPLKPLNL